MHNIHEARAVMRRSGWLSQTPKDFQGEVLERCLLQTVAAGQTIYAVGDPPGGMYGLVSGGLGVLIAPGERGPYFAHFARPGAWFGDAAALTRQPRRVGLAATRDTELLHLPLHEIDRLVGQDPELWRLFALVPIGHLDVAIGACDDLMIRDHVQRCIAILLRLGGCRQAARGAQPVDVDVSQEDLAVVANVARSTAGTVLRNLERDGHVELWYRRIRIAVPAALRAMLRD